MYTLLFSSLSIFFLILCIPFFNNKKNNNYIKLLRYMIPLIRKLDITIYELLNRNKLNPF